MSLNQPALVAITPQTPHNNNSFVKNITTRSSFCGTPTSSGKSFMNNRKSWNGNGTLPLQMTTPSSVDDFSPLERSPTPLLATFKSKKCQREDEHQRNGNYQRNVILECESERADAKLSSPNLNGNYSDRVKGDEILTPNGNRPGCEGNEMRRSAGNGHGRRYAEIGNWGARSSTFLEPHLQGIGWRTAPDSDHHSTEDDEQSLIKEEKAHFRKASIFHKGRDEVDVGKHLDSERLIKSREFFENLQDDRRTTVREDGRTSREGNQRSSGEKYERESHPALSSAETKELERDENFHHFPSAGYRDSLSQSRESLSSCGSGASDGEGARGDCEGSGSSSGSDPGVPCQVGLLERLVRTHPVWFLPGIQRAGAFHLLQGKEEGNFVVRQSSQPDTMALSVRLPPHAGPYIEHYLIHAGGGRIGLETSQNKFDNIPDLIAHYSQCCDELPVQLSLPRALREAKNRQQLSSLALLGQEFWRYPMANPKMTPQVNDQGKHCTNTPSSQTPSETGSSFSSFSISAGIHQNTTQSTTSTENVDKNIVLNLTPIEASKNPASNFPMTTFKGNPPSPPITMTFNKVSACINTDMGNFVRAPRPTPPNTLNLASSTANITQQQSCIAAPQSIKTAPPPPPPRWVKPPFPNIPNEIQCFNPVGMLSSKNGSANIMVTTTVTFSVNNHQQLTDEELSSPNDNRSDSFFCKSHVGNFDGACNILSSNNACQNMTSKRLSPEGECINTVQSLNGSLRRLNHANTPSGLVSPTQSTPFSDQGFQSKELFSPLNQIASPIGSNSITSGIFSPSQINSPLSNTTMSSKSGIFSPVSQVTSPAMNDLFSPVSKSSPVSGKSSMFSPVSNQSSFANNSGFNSPLMGKDKDRILSPNTNTSSTTPSGRCRRSKHAQRKESRHYQESDILESPGVYYRSSLGDKVSDYEDIWGPDQGKSNTPSSACSTFKPIQNRQDNDTLGSGILISKRPDLLPDTLPKVASLNGSVLSPSSPTTDESDKESQQKSNTSNGHQCIHHSSEKINMIIATTNSKGEAVAKRPDKLNLLRNANEQMNSENTEKYKLGDTMNNRNSNDEIERDNHKKNMIHDECSLLTSDFCNNAEDEQQPEKQGSPFYADPVDAIKEAVAPLVQRRRIVRSAGVSLAQRYSEPPGNSHPYYPLRDMHSIEELSPSSPNTSNSVDNLAAIKSGKPRGKAVQPPRIKTNVSKQDQTWTVDSSWEFISKQGDTPTNDNTKDDPATINAGGAFPSLAEQQSKLDAAAVPPNNTLTIHQVLSQKFPELNLSPYPTLLRYNETNPTNDHTDENKGCRMSCYDNVEARLAISSQGSDDGTVFSEPWDSSQWDSLIPPHDEPHSLQSSQNYDGEDDDSSTMREPSMTPPLSETPLRLATISRAKSFRDRLDPLLAPPRLQALRGNRRNGGTNGSNGAPGDGVRAYALHLAADKTTTFAKNVENFITCTKDSKETCPHIVMRNMRQFMSGMKNYLVKHGEREFEKEVEKERLKLKANEFLNLDSILEGVLHGAVITPLRSHIYGLLADKFAKSGDVAQLATGMRLARFMSPLQLGIRPNVRVPSNSELVDISQAFVKMQEADSPLHKLEQLLAAISLIYNSMKSGIIISSGGPIGADDFLPVLVLALARCSVAGAELEAEVMAGLLPPPILAGEGGYYLTTLFGAVAVLKKISSSEKNKPFDWRTGSLGSTLDCGSGTAVGSGVARVLVPDEFTGALRRVALPWRAGTRARDLCRALAHRARITNPQDYALYALRDGEEIMINEPDCLQDVISDSKYSNCMLAYKRSDAKIAWPKQAFSSYS